MFEFLLLITILIAGGLLVLKLGHFLLHNFNWRRRLPPTPPNLIKPQIEMVGREAQVVSSLGQGCKGTIKVEGELWSACLPGMDGTGWPEELEPGARVRVVAQQGLLLLVEPLPSNPPGW